MLCMAFLASCANEDINPSPTKDENKYGEFGFFHNDVIEDIFVSFPKNQTRGQQVSVAELKTICTDQATVSVISKDSQLLYQPSRITIQNISETPIDEIKANMTAADKSMIESIIRQLENGDSIVNIKAFVNASSLPLIKKEASLNFIDTYIASKNYWENNKDAWIEYIDENVEMIRTRSRWYDKVSWGQVAFSDAYYGWYGTLSSGCNIYVGAGAAAVGSVFSVLNQI